jgi:aryl-alcohol dehydrogenase-like predicted oxidoreductase
LAALEELVQEGKIRYPATSNYAAWQVAEMLGIAASRNYRRAAIAQQMYNVLNRRLEPEFVPMAKSRDVSVIVYNPLAGGFLTGKHRPGQPTSGTRFDGNAQYQRRYWQDADFDAVERLRKISAGCDRTVIDISLSWLLHHSAAECIILGASKQEHLVNNLKAAAGGPLPGKVLEALDEIWVQVGGIAVNYNR